MTRKLLLFIATVAAVGVMAVACAQSPVIVYIVVTATPDGANPNTAQVTAAPTEAAQALTPTAEATSGNAGTPDPNATLEKTVRQIYVAEQPFQRGRMFWLEPIDQVWVMVETEPGLGIWHVYEDLFEEGDPELDESLVPPTGLFQPVRGFGLIWRTGEDLRTNMGWATDVEVGFVTNYEYQPGEGSTAANFVHGYHFLQNQYGEWYRFNEINQTWQQIQRETPTATPTGTANE
jgi:hypothetical protein